MTVIANVTPIGLFDFVEVVALLQERIARGETLLGWRVKFEDFEVDAVEFLTAAEILMRRI